MTEGRNNALIRVFSSGRRKSPIPRLGCRSVFVPDGGHRRQGFISAAAISLLAIATGHTQTPEGASVDTLHPAAEAAAPHVLPANSTIVLLVEETLVSGVNAPGSSFRMQVAEDIRVDDMVVIPAGTAASGEIIDSKKKGMLGKAGFLVMSARLIHLSQHDIRLHSAMGTAGHSNTTSAFFVPFVYGENATVAQGTRVVARTVGDEHF